MPNTTTSFDWERTKPSARGTITISGVEILYGEINPLSNIRIEDIAHSLAIQNRFIGHTAHPYSIAQHCINCVYAASEEYASIREDYEFKLCLLLHDAAEAYIGDIISPVKKLLYEAINGGMAACEATIQSTDPSGHLAVYNRLQDAAAMESRLERDIARAFRLKELSSTDIRLINEIDSRMCATESWHLCYRQVPEGVTPIAVDPRNLEYKPWTVVKETFLGIFNDLCAKRG